MTRDCPPPPSNVTREVTHPSARLMSFQIRAHSDSSSSHTLPERSLPRNLARAWRYASPSNTAAPFQHVCTPTCRHVAPCAALIQVPAGQRDRRAGHGSMQALGAARGAGPGPATGVQFSTGTCAHRALVAREVGVELVAEPGRHVAQVVSLQVVRHLARRGCKHQHEGVAGPAGVQELHPPSSLGSAITRPCNAAARVFGENALSSGPANQSFFDAVRHPRVVEAPKPIEVHRTHAVLRPSHG